MPNLHTNKDRDIAGFPVKMQKMQGGEIKQDNLPQFEYASQLPSKYLHTFLFPPHSSLGMLSLSTCSLIPLLTAGQQVNWYTPPHRRWGVHLDETLLGGSCFGRLHTQGNDILGTPKSLHLAASIFLWLLTHADRAIQHSPAGMETHRLVV